MTRTLAEKVIEGLRSQGWEIIGHYGGTWAGAMRPLEEYVQRRIDRAVKAEREACAKVCDEQHDRARTPPGAARADACARAIRARGEKK